MVLIATVGMLTFPAVRDSLMLEGQIRELAAWLTIKEKFAQYDFTKLHDYPQNAVIKGSPELLEVQSGTEIPDTIPFTIHLPWTGEKPQQIHLIPVKDHKDCYYIGNVESGPP